MENNGILTLRPFRAGAPVLITGEARSGTTAMARAFTAGGFPVVFPDESANAEDPDFCRAWAEVRPDLVREWIQAHGRPDGRWAVKVPGGGTIAAWPKMKGVWPGDFLFLMRDPLARIAYGTTLGAEISHYMASFGAAGNLALAGHGVALVSYEKLIASPARVLGALALGLDAAAAAAAIIPEDPRYHHPGAVC